MLVTKDFHLVLIDHSRAFRRSPRFRRHLPFESDHAMVSLPRAFFARLEALKREELETLLGDWLTAREIDAMMARRKLILERLRARMRTPKAPKLLYDDGFFPAVPAREK